MALGAGSCPNPTPSATLPSALTSPPQQSSRKTSRTVRQGRELIRTFNPDEGRKEERPLAATEMTVAGGNPKKSLIALHESGQKHSSE